MDYLIENLPDFSLDVGRLLGFVCGKVTCSGYGPCLTKCGTITCEDMTCEVFADPE